MSKRINKDILKDVTRILKHQQKEMRDKLAQMEAKIEEVARVREIGGEKLENGLFVIDASSYFKHLGLDKRGQVEFLDRIKKLMATYHVYHVNISLVRKF